MLRGLRAEWIYSGQGARFAEDALQRRPVVAVDAGGVWVRQQCLVGLLGRSRQRREPWVSHRPNLLRAPVACPLCPEQCPHQRLPDRLYPSLVLRTRLARFPTLGYSGPAPTTI